MKSMKFFAIALLLSTAAAQADCGAGSCPKASGVTKVAVGCALGAVRHIVPEGLARTFCDAIAATAVMDGASDICATSKHDAPVKAAKPASAIDAVKHQLKRAALLVASCAAASAIKAKALPHVPAGLANVIIDTGLVGDMALTWATYGACNSALDAVMPAHKA
jgi:hypothetical protein